MVYVVVSSPLSMNRSWDRIPPWYRAIVKKNQFLYLLMNSTIPWNSREDVKDSNCLLIDDQKLLKNVRERCFRRTKTHLPCPRWQRVLNPFEWSGVEIWDQLWNFFDLLFGWSTNKGLEKGGRKDILEPNLIWTTTCLFSGQGCQMVYFQTKNFNFSIFWRALEWKMLADCTAIWYILQPIGIFYTKLVHFIAIW
jgi:hypothetical protein